MDAILSMILVGALIGMMGMSLIVDVLRYAPDPDKVEAEAPAVKIETSVPPQTAVPTPAPIPTKGAMEIPTGFRGPTGPPSIKGPNQPPPSY